MRITTIGINHKSSPIEIREKFCLSSSEQEFLLSELKNDPSVIGAIVLSTCNRMEIYAHMLDNDADRLIRALFRVKDFAPTVEMKKYFYACHNRKAIEHMFRVVGSLDSLIIGEKQILGQFKGAVELARKIGMMDKRLNVLSNLAVRVGKKAQNETQIGRGGSSISWAAVNMAQKKMGVLSDKSMLVIGAGKMGHLAVSRLKQKNVGGLYVMNRTREKAVALAEQFGGVASAFWEIKEILKTVDVCICSADAPHYLIDKDLIKEVMSFRKNKKLVLIDISMPRNINPEVSNVTNVDLFAIDDLDKVVEANVQKRHLAVGQVEAIISDKVDEFYAKMAKLAAVEERGFYAVALAG